jgi:hypothetical protein
MTSTSKKVQSSVITELEKTSYQEHINNINLKLLKTDPWIRLKTKHETWQSLMIPYGFNKSTLQMLHKKHPKVQMFV